MIHRILHIWKYSAPAGNGVVFLATSASSAVNDPSYSRNDDRGLLQRTSLLDARLAPFPLAARHQPRPGRADHRPLAVLAHAPIQPW